MIAGFAGACRPYRTHGDQLALLARLLAAGAVSPRFLKDPTAALRFRVEAEGYLSQRPHGGERTVDAFADHVSLTRATRLLIAVPVYVSEDLVPLLSSLSRMRDVERTHVLLLVNAPASVSEAEFGRHVERHLAIASTFRRLQVSILAARFTEPRLGEVRAWLLDAAVLASLRAGLADPLLLSLDADQIAAASSLVAQVIGAFARPRLDVAVGHLLYSGCDPAGRPRTIARPCPEVVVGAKYLAATDAATARGWWPSGPDVFTPGANSAFRIATVCAAGGYDRTLGGGEDIDIGQRVKAIRMQARTDRLVRVQHARRLDRAWVCTSSRRAIRAILDGETVCEQWRSFASVSGATLDTATLGAEYESRADLIQLTDLIAPPRRWRANVAKVRDRVRTIAIRSVRADSLDDEPIIRKLMGHMGLRLTTCRWSGDDLADMGFDWADSLLLERLRAWAERNRQRRQ